MGAIGLASGADNEQKLLLDSKSENNNNDDNGFRGLVLEKKIDWFQLIQAEKTVGGSRILQE